jgi:3-hydroxyisobutyrate dehydrogenase-like beta-hydroxyacid dehydrogenase
VPRQHFVKDLGIAVAECQQMGLSLPGLALAHSLYISLAAHGEDACGTQVSSSSFSELSGNI